MKKNESNTNKGRREHGEALHARIAQLREEHRQVAKAETSGGSMAHGPMAKSASATQK